jgi:hypothetical protein
MLIRVLVVWCATTAVGFSLYLGERRRSQVGPQRRALDRSAVAAGFGTGLMVEYMVATFRGTLATLSQHARPIDLPVLVTAWAGLVLGPLVLIDSMRLANPFKGPRLSIAARALLCASWVTASAATVLDAAST